MHLTLHQLTTHPAYSPRYDFDVEEFSPWDILERLFGPAKPDRMAIAGMHDGTYLFSARQDDEKMVVFEARVWRWVENGRH